MTYVWQQLSVHDTEGNEALFLHKFVFTQSWTVFCSHFFTAFLLIYELKFLMFYASHFDLSAFLWVLWREKKVAHLLIKTISWCSSVWSVDVLEYLFFTAAIIFFLILLIWSFLYAVLFILILQTENIYIIWEKRYFGVSTLVIDMLILLQDTSFMTSMPNVNKNFVNKNFAVKTFST